MEHTIYDPTASLNNVPLKDMYAELKKRQELKHDLVAPAELVRMDDGGEITYPDYRGVKLPKIEGVTTSGDSGTGFMTGRVTDIAHETIADRYTIPRSYYNKMRGGHDTLLAQNVNHWLREDGRNGKNLFLRTYDSPNGGGILRGMFSDRYRVIDNMDVLGTLLMALDQRGVNAEFKGCDLTERRMYVRLEFPDMQFDLNKLIKRDGSHDWHRNGDDPWFGGLIIANSETGQSSFWVKPRLVREVCSNGVIIEQQVQRQFHLGKRQNEGFHMSDRTQKLENDLLFSRIEDLVEALTDKELFREFLVQFAAADANLLRHPKGAVDNVARNLRLSDNRTDQLIEKFMESGRLTQFGVADAVTWLAHEFENEDAEMAVTLEAAGGQILTTAPKHFSASVDIVAN